MPAPFYNAISSVAASAPGTGAFTPGAAVAGGFWPWSDVPVGWMGRVRFQDGTDFEDAFAYWNGTTLSRGANQVLRRPNGNLSTSTGALLSLSSSATATMVAAAGEVMSHPGKGAWCIFAPNPGHATTNTVLGFSLTASGTASPQNLSSTNYLTRQPRTQHLSGTTTGSAAGWSPNTPHGIHSTTAGLGGLELTARFGLSAMVATTRLCVGWRPATPTGEPSAMGDFAAFAKDSSDTNIQLMSNTGSSGAATKLDTGIPLVRNGWYEASIWIEPGGDRAFGLLMRLDTGDIWHGSLSGDMPFTNSGLRPGVEAFVGSVAGAAVAMQAGNAAFRRGSQMWGATSWGVTAWGVGKAAAPAPPPTGGTGGVKHFSGSVWSIKPVKVWDGSSWVTKPLKRWDGTAWVLTPQHQAFTRSSDLPSTPTTRNRFQKQGTTSAVTLIGGNLTALGSRAI